MIAESAQRTRVPAIGLPSLRGLEGRATIAPDRERAPLVRKAVELCASGLHLAL